MKLSNVLGIQPKRSKSIKGIKGTYSERNLRGVLGYPHRKRIMDLINILANYKNNCVLDIGCQDLFIDSYICDNQRMLIGCDLNWDNGLYFAQENILLNQWENVYIIQSIGEFLPLKDSLFDLILCLDTLEHVNNEDEVIEEIYRVSTEDATLIISLPVEFGLILLLKQIFRYIFRYNDYFGEVNNRYTLKELLNAGISLNLNGVKRVKHTHKGYDFRNTVKNISPKFCIISKINIPFRWLPDSLSYGVILIFRKN